MSPNQLYQNTHEYQLHTTPSTQTNDSPFPILVIAVLSIAGTAFLLVSYYIFIIKCCSSLHQIDHLFRRLSAWRPQTDQDPFIALSPSMWNHGLDQSVIHEIPTAQYKRRAVEGSNAMYGCTVCLNEFQEQDMLRVLPRCSHQFHLDCIDVWLQTNSNCPLCRSSISGNSQYPFDQIIAPSSSPQDSIPYTDSLLGGDEDFVVIELGGGAQHGGDGSRNFVSSPASVQPTTCQSDKKLEKSKPRKQNHASIMGDECIDVRKKDDQFYIQPIRRSFSLDSAKSQQLYLTVQTVIQQNRQQRESGTAQESDRRVQRSSHSFRHGQGSRNAIFPI